MKIFSIKLFLLVSLIAFTNINEAISAPQASQVLSSAWEAPVGLQQIPIWPSDTLKHVSKNQGFETTQRMTPPAVKPGREYTQILNVSTPTLTVFPPKGKNTGASIIVFPGGGFRIIAIDLEGSEICDWITTRGVTCILLKYRVPGGNHYWDKGCKCHITPKAPFALHDAQRTIKLVRSRANELKIDPNKVGVIGFSAGGYLVAQTSNIAQSDYEPVDEIDKLSSRPNFAIALYPGHLCRKGRTFDPTTKVTSQAPPTFLLQAWDDPVDNICNSTLYAKALSEAGVPTEVHLFAKGGHAFGLRSQNQPISAWPSLVEKWLEEIEILPPYPKAL